MITPNVWIGCLACYSTGQLNGLWISAVDADTFDIAELHDPLFTDHQELWCFDHEDIPVQGELSPTSAAMWGRTIERIDENLRPAFLAWISEGLHPGPEEEDTLVQDFQEAYQGEWETFHDFAEDMAKNSGVFDDIPEHLHPFISIDNYARYLRDSYDSIRTPQGDGVFIYLKL